MSEASKFNSSVSAAWPTGDEQHEFLGHAIERLSAVAGTTEKAGATLLAEAKRGRLPSWVWSPPFGFFSLMESFWVAPEAEIRERLSTLQGKWLGDDPKWLFVDRKAVDRLIWKHGPRAPTPFRFDMDRPKWPLFDACIWVAVKGGATTNEDIALEGLDDLGAVQLFERLADQPIFGGFYAYGEIPTYGTRQKLSPSNWQSAHTGWRDSGPFVQFYQSRDNRPGHEHEFIAADMHRHWMGASDVNIWVFRDELIAQFPAQVPEEAERSKPGRKPLDNTQYVARILELITAAKARGEKLSANAAAKMAAKENPGPYSEAATQKRIYGAFCEAYPEHKRTYFRDQPVGAGPNCRK